MKMQLVLLLVTLLIKVSRVITSDKLTSTEIYYMLNLKVQNEPSSNIYFENLFNPIPPGGVNIS